MTHYNYIERRKEYYAKKEQSKEKKQEKAKEKTNILEMVLSFDDNQVRVLGTYEEPWFVGKDVATILGYSNNRDALIKHVDDEDKVRLNEWCHEIRHQPGSSMDPQTILVNESGLYSLILRSKLPKAKLFKKWVTSEVLPSIRRRGSYTASPEMKAEFEVLNSKLKQTEQLLIESKKEIKQVIKDSETEIFKANQRCERLKERKSHVKYKAGNCVYITQNMKEIPADYKFGITDDINARMATYRTNAPYTKIMYLVFVHENKFVEDYVKIAMKDSIVPVNHEFVTKSDTMDIVQKIEEIIKMLNLEHKVEENLHLYNRCVEDDYENEVKNRD
jgi:prophage antirepressor-like protein